MFAGPIGLLRDAKDSFAAWRKTQTVTVAVAGLSLSGKTTFITSVIANLEAASNATAQKWLNGLDVVDTQRFLSAKRPSAFKATQGHLFPYSAMLTALCAEAPRWPIRTANTYEAALDLRFYPKNKPKKTSAPWACLRLIFVDYPGEWLADVPMARQGYADWSETAISRLSAFPWSDLSGAFRSFVSATAWQGPDDDNITQLAALEWQRVLLAARDKGLKWLQPAQFLRKHDQSASEDIPALQNYQTMWFCPLPSSAISAAKKGSLAAAMASRYSAYQSDVRHFFSETLKDASHHLLLVDVLEALAEGEHAFHETAAVFGEVYAALADSQPGRFMALFKKSGFEKVLLVATKADTVPPNQRAALSSLLKDMCSGAVAGNADIAPPEAVYTAAIRATEDVDGMVDGAAVRVVRGLCPDGKLCQVISIDIPPSMPDSDYFKRREGLRLPRFAPIKVEALGRRGIPNVWLGKVLDDLLGDLLK